MLVQASSGTITGIQAKRDSSSLFVLGGEISFGEGSFLSPYATPHESI